MTNSCPFIENDIAADIKVQIATRRIDWGSLDQAGVSSDGSCWLYSLSLGTVLNVISSGIDFIRCLLEYDPKQRMSLTAALSRDWLNPAANHQLNLQAVATEASITSIPGDASMLSAFPSEAQMQDAEMSTEGDDAISGAQLAINELSLSTETEGVHPTSNMPGAFPGNGRHPLERRSQVLAREAEASSAVANPPADGSDDESWHVVNEEDVRGQNSRGGKRKMSPENEGLSPLSAIPEDSMESISEPVTKRGRPDAGGAESPVNTRSAKGGRGRATPQTKGRTRADQQQEDELPALRRSTRTPAKGARKS